MSLTRQFLREFRPLFRMLEEPFGRAGHPFAGSSNTALASRSPVAIFNDPFFSRGFDLNVPAVDVTEHGNEFIVEAELPGVKKENIDVRIGDGGQSLTIEGRKVLRSPIVAEGQEITESKDTVASSEGLKNNEAALTTKGSEGDQVGTQLSSERTFSSTASFSRTVWLPRQVDASSVKAKLEDGILTLHIPKVEDTRSVRVDID